MESSLRDTGYVHRGPRTHHVTSKDISGGGRRGPSSSSPRLSAEATPPTKPSCQGPCRKGRPGDPSGPPTHVPSGTQHWAHDPGSPPGHDSSLSGYVSVPGMILCLWLCVCCDTHMSPQQKAGHPQSTWPCQTAEQTFGIQSHLGPRDPETWGCAGNSMCQNLPRAGSETV